MKHLFFFAEARVGTSISLIQKKNYILYKKPDPLQELEKNESLPMTNTPYPTILITRLMRKKHGKATRTPTH